MRDPRITKLAHNLIHHSVSLVKGERILIEVDGIELPLAKALIKEAFAIGGIPFVIINDHELLREIIIGCNEQQLKDMAQYDLARISDMDAYIWIRAGDNAFQLNGLDSEKYAMYRKFYFQKINGKRYNSTKWCVLRYPNHAMAQQAKMSTDALEDLYFNVCNLDYSKMDSAMDHLVEYMQNTDRVRVKSKGTDLTFSIKGMPVIKDAGKMNLPDGEIYTMPVKESVNGMIQFNTPSPKEGFTYDHIHLEIKNGYVINATANDNLKLNALLDTDAGSRYIGEFGIGLNPYIEQPMNDVLFDEKIWGSFHLAVGCVPLVSTGNDNQSSIHWDVVHIQRPEYGGGKMWFDDILIRKDGRFVPKELQVLNPEKLK